MICAGYASEHTNGPPQKRDPHRFFLLTVLLFLIPILFLARGMVCAGPFCKRGVRQGMRHIYIYIYDKKQSFFGK